MLTARPETREQRQELGRAVPVQMPSEGEREEDGENKRRKGGTKKTKRRGKKNKKTTHKQEGKARARDT